MKTARNSSIVITGNTKMVKTGRNQNLSIGSFLVTYTADKENFVTTMVFFHLETHGTSILGRIHISLLAT